MSLYALSSPQGRRFSPSPAVSTGQVSALRFWWVSQLWSSRNSSGWDVVARCTLEVLHIAVDFLLHPVCQQAKFLLSDSGGCSSSKLTCAALRWRFEFHRAVDLLLHPVCQQVKPLPSDSGGSESPTRTPVARWTCVALHWKFSTGP